MLSLQADRLKMLSVPVSTGWLLGECMEARGKQELWTRQRQEVLAALREQAVIQSAESSNRIEGVTVAGDRLRPLTVIVRSGGTSAVGIGSWATPGTRIAHVARTPAETEEDPTEEDP